LEIDKRGGCKSAPFGRIINRVNNVKKIGTGAW
jgi:hypothetical protein